MFRRFRNFISKPTGLAFTNATLLCIVTLINIYFQAFCRPTLWATVVLFVCFTNTIVYPLLKTQTRLFNISSFISGVSLGVFIYCIIFLGHLNYFGFFLILMLGLGLVTFIPHIFVIQLFLKYIIRPCSKRTRIFFLTGFLVFILTALFFGLQYRQALKSIDQFQKSGQTSLNKTWMTEKIFGMYFKYHTEICEWDGWRPPIHEPALVIGQWLNGRQDPLGLSYYPPNLAKRIDLYKKFFPYKRIKYDCSCAVDGASRYHNDEIFKTP